MQTWPVPFVLPHPYEAEYQMLFRWLAASYRLWWPNAQSLLSSYSLSCCRKSSRNQQWTAFCDFRCSSMNNCPPSCSWILRVPQSCSSLVDLHDCFNKVLPLPKRFRDSSFYAQTREQRHSHQQMVSVIIARRRSRPSICTWIVMTLISDSGCFRLHHQYLLINIVIGRFEYLRLLPFLHRVIISIFAGVLTFRDGFAVIERLSLRTAVWDIFQASLSTSGSSDRN